MTLAESNIKPAGRQAPDFDLMGTNGDTYTLKDFAFKRGLCVVFTCNHCPYAKASRAPLIELSYQFTQIGFVAINSNDADAYPEDSFEHMKAFTGKYGIPFHYLYDESQEVAKAYDAQCTPDVYLFKNNNWTFELFYQGRINDNRQDSSSVKERNLEEQCRRLVVNESPAQDWIPSMGCSIKWK